MDEFFYGLLAFAGVAAAIVAAVVVFVIGAFIAWMNNGSH